MAKYLTIKEAAKFLGVSSLTLRNWDRRGKLTAIRHPVNNYRLYTFSELERFLKSFEGRRPRKLKVKLLED
ncbi:MAG: MerR family DNA-binding transcriptional regulator [Candidatus Niyogibacteria bacterium]|nr:MerR family DNA-binding transcriptional regulator [Candidatus Niyogibacteria bacterium]